MNDKSKNSDKKSAKSELSALSNLPVYKLNGSKSSEKVSLDPKLFGLERNDHVLYLAVKAELTNRRQGTHSTKTRSQVRGGGRKPWRQKGRGTARVGTNRSPIWRGGGITFGPQPHDYSMKLPAKVKKLARKVAYSVKAQSNSIAVVEDFEMDAPKTKTISQFMNSMNLSDKPALLLTDGNKQNIVKSCRNIPYLEVRDPLNASTYDLLKANKVIICKSAVERLEGGLADAK